jgi:hypothetical protein
MDFFGLPCFLLLFARNLFELNREMGCHHQDKKKKEKEKNKSKVEISTYVQR